MRLYQFNILMRPHLSVHVKGVYKWNTLWVAVHHLAHPAQSRVYRNGVSIYVNMCGPVEHYASENVKPNVTHSFLQKIRTNVFDKMANIIFLYYLL